MTYDFLPVCTEDMADRGIEQFDFIYIIGDAYVDHPSFGHAVISRILDAHGYRVGIISQPDWKDDNSITILGRPRLSFLVTAGNMDSMVNHYSVSKRRRETDAFTPGGVIGKRPDYATVCYTNMIRRVYKDVPIIIGGLEASLRRFSHYDYWSNQLKRSILLDSSADLLLYGMGEKSIIEAADALNSGIAIQDLTFLNGSCYKTKKKEDIYDALYLPDYQTVKSSKEAYAKSFYLQYQNTDPFTAKRLVEAYDHGLYLVQNPPAPPLSTKEMDHTYALPYMRAYHPSYEKAGGVPAITEVKYSLVSSRGCFGGCSFCALTFHQGRMIQTRSHESMINEARQFVWEEEFKGYIHDVGGPTANFRMPSCEKQLTKGVCKDKQCLFPKPCKNLHISHHDYISLLRKLRDLPQVKKVFVRSGIRYDYLIHDPDQTFLKELCEHHVSGQLKVAPEHISDVVLQKMGKPPAAVYQKFVSAYQTMNQKLEKKQYLVPYLMSSHPGSTLKEAIELAEFLRDMGYMPEQVQDFYPTPATISTCMYYSGLDPRTMQKVYTAVNPHEKAMQRALIQYRNPKNYHLVKEALQKADRTDLIGYDKKCLIRPEKTSYREKKLSPQSAGKPVGKKAKKKKTIRNVHKKA